MYLASQVLRYAVTRTDEAKQASWSALAAVEMLNHVTGLVGLVIVAYHSVLAALNFVYYIAFANHKLLFVILYSAACPNRSSLWASSWLWQMVQHDRATVRWCLHMERRHFK